MLHPCSYKGHQRKRAAEISAGQRPAIATFRKQKQHFTTCSRSSAILTHKQHNMSPCHSKSHCRIGLHKHKPTLCTWKCNTHNRNMPATQHHAQTPTLANSRLTPRYTHRTTSTRLRPTPTHDRNNTVYLPLEGTLSKH